MNIKETMLSIGAIFLVTSTVARDTSTSKDPGIKELNYINTLYLSVSQSINDSDKTKEISTTNSNGVTKGGTFKFETPHIFNGEVFVKESSKVNFTFTILNGNCSDATHGDIEIYKTGITETTFEPQCRILSTCKPRQPRKKVLCYCLDMHGFYSVTFVANRNDTAKWMWSVENKNIQNAIVKINITYPPRIIRLEILGYGTFIPKSRSVTVVCSWVNGNPPSRVSLLDRHNALLEKGDKSGNISYTFQSVGCSDAGVIRCEADGSDRSVSASMLVECPPEFIRNTSNIPTVSVGQSVDFTFPFRSHTSHISSCHVNQILQKTTDDSNQFQTDVSNCTEAVRNGSTCTFNLENKYCLYCVTGEPPDLQLTIFVSNLKRENGGLWYVTISNDKGSGEMYFRVNIKVGKHPVDGQVILSQDLKLSPLVTAGIVIGVTTVTAIVIIIVICIIKGKDEYAKLRRKGKKEIVLYRGLGIDSLEHSQTQSGIYYEIQDSQLETDQQPTARKSSTGVNDLPCNNSLHLVEITNEKRMDCLQPAPEEIGTSKFSEESACVQQMSIEPPTSRSQNIRVCLQTVLAESPTSNVRPVSDYLKLVHTGNDTNSVQQRSEYLKLVHTGNEENNEPLKSDYPIIPDYVQPVLTSTKPQKQDYLEPVLAEGKTSTKPQRTDYLEPVLTKGETSTKPQKTDYLEPVLMKGETSTKPQKTDYLEPVLTEGETSTKAQKPDYLEPVLTEGETSTKPQKPDYLEHVLTEGETSTKAQKTDYLEPVLTEGETSTKPQKTDYLEPVLTEGETSTKAQKTDYLEPVLTEGETSTKAQKTDYLEPVLTEGETSTKPQKTDYLEPVLTEGETSTKAQKTDYLEPVLTEGETSTKAQKTDYLEPVLTEGETSTRSHKSDYLEHDQRESETSN